MAGRPVQEDASKLLFGPDFENATPLMNSEVTILLEQHKADQQDAAFDPNDAGLYQESTLDYTKKFGEFDDPQQVRKVRELLEAGGNLHPFEVAALANLCPGSVEEARTILPTLTMEKISDDDLDALLSELVNESATVTGL